MDDIRRGWSAPVLLVIVCTLMMVPVSAVALMVIGGLFGGDVGMATAFAGIVQIVGTFWIAGIRLRRSGR